MHSIRRCAGTSWVTTAPPPLRVSNIECKDVHSLRVSSIECTDVHSLRVSSIEYKDVHSLRVSNLQHEVNA
jgi:hypothetical protein